MAIPMKQGADIVINRWCRVQPGERVLIITDEVHTKEGSALWHAADAAGALAVTVIVPEHLSQPGRLMDSMTPFLEANNLIIGATNYSLITTRAVREVLEQGCRFLSLPLSTNDKDSALCYTFMDMDPAESARLAQGMLAALERAERVRITTALGTDLTFGKKGRRPGLFNGMTDKPGKVGSSSFEIYIGVEETVTSGRGVVDASLGYIGRPQEPIELRFEGGRLVDIQDSPAGRQLRDYMEQFRDPRIYVAGELGIGLNRKSHCRGHCYIEDESTFGTFHIGMGRNLALGGCQDANGHFDLVFQEPDIYADGLLIMKQGKPAL